MPGIHELLDDSQRKCQSLAEEIKSFKESRVLHQKATESLDATSQTLIATAQAIRPFTNVKMRKFFIFVIIACLLNSLLFAAILFVLLKAT